MPKNLITDQDAYRTFARQHKCLPLFYEPWWLDSASHGGTWQAIMCERDAQVIAVWTYFVKRHGPFRYVTMPPFTRYMGPYFVRQIDSEEQSSVVAQMTDALPKLHGLTQTLHPSIATMPALKQAYTLHDYYTYVLPDISDLDRVWQGIDATYRNNKYARHQDKSVVAFDLPEDISLKLFAQPYIRQNIPQPYSDQQLASIMNALVQQGCGCVVAALDLNGQPQAAHLLAWDQQCTYLLTTGETLLSRSMQMGLVTTWRCIEYASRQLPGKSFDFLGSMLPNVASTRKSLGATKTHYLGIHRAQGLFSVLLRWRRNRQGLSKPSPQRDSASSPGR